MPSILELVGSKPLVAVEIKAQFVSIRRACGVICCVFAADVYTPKLLLVSRTGSGRNSPFCFSCLGAR